MRQKPQGDGCRIQASSFGESMYELSPIKREIHFFLALGFRVASTRAINSETLIPKASQSLKRISTVGDHLLFSSWEM
jgi:hypothetical protein